MRGSLGEKIGEGACADVHAWAPGQVVKLFKAGVSQRFSRHEARKTRAVFAAGAPGAGGVRRGDPGRTLRHRAAAPRRTDPAAALADRRHDVRAGGGDPRDSRHIRSQDAPAAGGPLAARLDGERVAVRRRQASEAHRHRRPRPDRSPAAGRRACHCDLHPGNVIMTAEGPRLLDWTVAIARPPPSTLGSATSSFRARPGSRRQSGAAARDQCGPAVRVRAAGRHVPRGADGGDQSYLPSSASCSSSGGAVPALRERLMQRVEAALRPED